MTSLDERLRFLRDHRWTPGRLSAYVDGELADSARGRVRRHITECPECRATLGSLETLMARLSDLSAVAEPAPLDLAAMVRQRLGQIQTDSG